MINFISALHEKKLGQGFASELKFSYSFTAGLNLTMFTTSQRPSLKILDMRKLAQGPSMQKRNCNLCLGRKGKEKIQDKILQERGRMMCRGH